jgi:hypothetical protein
MVRRDWCPLSKATGNYALQQILSGEGLIDGKGRGEPPAIAGVSHQQCYVPDACRKTQRGSGMGMHPPTSSAFCPAA